MAEDRSSEQDRSRFTFQQDWFELIRPEGETRTVSLRSQKLRILEIGSFEGASTTWILDNLMDHPDSQLVAVDTFGGGMEHQDFGTNRDKYGLSSLEIRFRQNISKCKQVPKLRVLKMRSEDALVELRTQLSRFDLIYIDASHVAGDVLHDAVLAWRMLEEGGTLIFDDFSWKGYLEDCYNPRIAIEAFARCFAPEIESEETESQLWIKKVPNHITATPNPDPSLYYWGVGLAKKP